ncbi:hypothetical protein K438DRAFT_1994789 [Mycena galopus ATCC 62051]|nr:hypothetical protein K438DRAFT_1994789 [Mycena galopus ATCC 62051]
MCVSAASVRGNATAVAAFSPSPSTCSPPPSSPHASLPTSLKPNSSRYSKPSSTRCLWYGSTHMVLAACTAAPPSSTESSLVLDHELRRTVPRDAGEPQRRRKRSKELGTEVDVIVGLTLGLFPPSSDPSSSASSSSSSLCAPDAKKKAVKEKATGATIRQPGVRTAARREHDPASAGAMCPRLRQRWGQGKSKGGESADNVLRVGGGRAATQSQSRDDGAESAGSGRRLVE